MIKGHEESIEDAFERCRVSVRDSGRFNSTAYKNMFELKPQPTQYT